jgi:cyclic beta-1,2-glucan synthetase
MFLIPWLVLPEISEKINDFNDFDEIPTLRGLAKSDVESLPSIRDWPSSNRTPDQIRWFEEFKQSVIDSRDRSAKRIAAIENLALQCGELSMIEYDFLYDKERHLQAIGYNVDERRRDSSFYDLLASEARFCSFVAIAQGKIPQESWFALSRLITATGGDPVLLSWSGSMFEYLMPLLVMPTYENTLLDQTYKAAVKRQIDYGRQRGIPWGMSESGYNMVDANLNYQYRAFGVPGMGLKRGLADDQVIAPYASFLALMVAPEEACLNLERLVLEKMVGKFGFFEAIDYTPSRLPRGQAGVTAT